MSKVEIFTPHGTPPDEGAIKQMATCMAEGDAVAGALSADHHLGYSMPIGGVIAYPNHVSPSGVGYDIGCGNKAVATSLIYSDIRADLPRIMDEVFRRISFGMGRPNDEPVDHPVLDKIDREAPTRQIKRLSGLAHRQLGTVGGGNHYVDLFREDKTDRVWIGVHFGSRGFGHKIANGFLALAQGKDFEDKGEEGGMYAPPTLLDTRGSLGHLYAEAMSLAGEYAYAGRDVVVDKVLEILGNPDVIHSVHNHHNFAWRENIKGVDCWVVRKGCTPLYPGQEGFVGGSMGESAVIIRGRLDGVSIGDGNIRTAINSLYSAPHGAGRAMSRTEAKGKQRKRSRCPECGHTQGRGEPAFNNPLDPCPNCNNYDTKRVWVQEQEGKVNWPAVKARLEADGIVLRGGDADEAPEAYKRLPEVIAAHEPYVQTTHTLHPIGVAMAGNDTFDPYKD
jgi:tRNA-splicing ligase RtcB (3'-phosphate/5'-hydroxy nucleic acid ligase)